MFPSLSAFTSLGTRVRASLRGRRPEEDRRRWPRLVRPATLTLATILLVLVLLAARVPLLELIELRTYDFRVQLSGSRPPSPAVVIAAIDEKSLEIEGRWPWPRSKMAALVQALSRDGARVIGFDIAFAEPDETSSGPPAWEVAVERVAAERPRPAPLAGDRVRTSDNDLALARALQRSPARVVLGYFFHLREEDLGYRLAPEDLADRVRRIGGSRFPLILSTEPDLGAVPFLQVYAPQPNLDVLTEAAGSSGYFSVLSDIDGILRWVPLAVKAGDDVFPSLALVCAWEYLGRPELVLRAGRYGVDSVELGDLTIPTHETGQLLVNYLGPPRTFPHLSVTDVLRGKLPAGTFQDRVVVVGATAVGTHDLRSTPVAPVYPGTELHATVIDNILTGRLLARPKWWRVFDVLNVIALTTAVGAALPRLGPVKGLAVQTSLLTAFLALAAWLFARHGMWLDVVHPVLALSINYTGITTYRYLTEQRERRRIKTTFRQYVAPLVVEEMLKRPEQLRLGGEEKVLTVLFSDLEGFTSYSERHSPREMIEILSEYYGRVTERVFAHRGTLKEYVGDELMAFFGAPLEQPDHAQLACAAALEMREQRLALNAEWAHAGRPQLRARTGINSGPMLVGNLGSRYRFAYGVLGDQVNLGSRLEGLNRVYGTEILLGENTARLVGDAFRLREIDLVRAKGKQRPVRVYELLARAGASLPPGRERAITLYASGLDAYRRRRWREALTRFEEALAASPDDGPSRALAERCRRFEQEPPVAEDGVFEQTLRSLKDVG